MSLRRYDVDQFFDYGIHIPSRTLFLGTEVDELMAEMFLKAMALLNQGSNPIRVIMNNIGGDEYHGLAIYDAIATSQCHITVTVYGHAMSMGSWILQAADDRILSPNSTLMLHYGTWTVDDHVREVRTQAREMERLNLLMETAYLDRMKVADQKFSLQKLRRMLESDKYLNAVESVELGLADRILSHG